MLHHHLEELDDDLGGRPDHNLALAALLSVADVVKSIVEDTDTHHFCDKAQNLSEMKIFVKNMA